MNFEIPESKEYLEKLIKTLEILLDRCLIDGRNAFWSQIEIPSLTEQDRTDIYAFLHRLKVIHVPSARMRDLIIVNMENAKAYLVKLRKSQRLGNDVPSLGNRASRQKRNGKNNKAPTEYRVSVNEAGEVYINDIKLTKRTPHKGGENAWLIQHLWEHPNKTFSRQQLNELRAKDELDELKRQRLTIGKHFRKFAQNLYFRGILQKVFFEFENNKKRNIDTIRFINPVSTKLLKKSGIPPILDLKRIIAAIHKSGKRKRPKKT